MISEKEWYKEFTQEQRDNIGLIMTQIMGTNKNDLNAFIEEQKTKERETNESIKTNNEAKAGENESSSTATDETG